MGIPPDTISDEKEAYAESVRLTQEALSRDDLSEADRAELEAILPWYEQQAKNPI